MTINKQDRATPDAIEAFLRTNLKFDDDKLHGAVSALSGG
jgi:hypothetical protein